MLIIGTNYTVFVAKAGIASAALSKLLSQGGASFDASFGWGHVACNKTKKCNVFECIYVMSALRQSAVPAIPFWLQIGLLLLACCSSKSLVSSVERNRRIRPRRRQKLKPPNSKFDRWCQHAFLLAPFPYERLSWWVASADDVVDLSPMWIQLYSCGRTGVLAALQGYRRGI